MSYEELLETAARAAGAMRGASIAATRHVPVCDRQRFDRAAMRLSSRYGVEVFIEHDGETASATFRRVDDQVVL